MMSQFFIQFFAQKFAFFFIQKRIFFIKSILYGVVIFNFFAHLNATTLSEKNGKEPIVKTSPVNKVSDWVNPASIQVIMDLIPPPPRFGSAAEQVDVDTIVALQTVATQEQKVHAQSTTSLSIMTFLSSIDKTFSLKSFPKTEKFFLNLKHLSDKTTDILKFTYRRERPFRAYPHLVKLIVTNDPSFYSYPSGHSAAAWLCALVLGEICPEYRGQFINLALLTCQDRVIAGMHYPSDTLAGRIEAEEIFRYLIHDPIFVRELTDLRNSEWSNFLKNK